MYKMNRTYHNKIFVQNKGKLVTIKYTKNTQFGGNQLSNCIFVGRHDNIRHATIQNPTKSMILRGVSHPMKETYYASTIKSNFIIMT